LGDNKDVRVIPRHIRGASTKSLGLKKKQRTLKELKNIEKHNKLLKQRREVQNGGLLQQRFDDRTIESKDPYNTFPSNNKGKNYADQMSDKAYNHQIQQQEEAERSKLRQVNGMARVSRNRKATKNNKADLAYHSKNNSRNMSRNSSKIYKPEPDNLSQ
jgi:hypothetical protein